jgi:hypothetical protein
LMHTSSAMKSKKFIIQTFIFIQLMKIQKYYQLKSSHRDRTIYCDILYYENNTYSLLGYHFYSFDDIGNVNFSVHAFVSYKFFPISVRGHWGEMRTIGRDISLSTKVIWYCSKKTNMLSTFFWPQSQSGSKRGHGNSVLTGKMEKNPTTNSVQIVSFGWWRTYL